MCYGRRAGTEFQVEVIAIFRDGIASHDPWGDRYNRTFSRRRPEKVTREATMYSGSLIDELITTVERAEESALEETYIHDERVAYWYSVAQQELAQFDSGLAGVA